MKTNKAHLSDYEKIREKNIEENKKAFKIFKLEQLKSDVARGSLQRMKPKFFNTIEALEVEFSFISKSLDDPKQGFCQICQKTLTIPIPKMTTVHAYPGLKEKIEIHANSINHKRNINPAEFDAALEVEFSFISKSLECSDKMFCKICKMEVLPYPLRIQRHKKSKIHCQNVIFSEFPFVSRLKYYPNHKNAFCKNL